MEHSAANRLEGIEPFPLDHDSGSMALHALKSSLDALDARTTYQRIAGLSGVAFKFVYDSTEAFEPLRDICPTDALTEAATALGFDNAHWETGKPIADVKSIIKHEIDSGRPVIAPFLKVDAYHGFFIITGYDYDRDIFYLQGAFEGQADEITVPIPEAWDGPTVSPLGWAANPVFVIGERTQAGQETLVIGREPIDRAINEMKGGKLTYGVHRGEKAYMNQPGPHEASYGLPAYDLLSSDIENQKFVARNDGNEQLNFGLIWRIDSQLGQLEHDRKKAAMFARFLRREIPAEKAAGLNEIMLNLDQTAEDAKVLRKFFWHPIPDTMNAPEEVVEHVQASSSMIFNLPDDSGLHEGLRALGFGIFRTVWGWVLVDDRHDKRMLAKTALRRIVVREQRSLQILEDIVDHIGRKSSKETPERPSDLRRRN